VRPSGRRLLAAAVGAAVVVGVVAAALAPAGAAGGGSSTTLHLGYFPNVTHAPALVGVEGGLYKQALGPNVDLKLSTFNAGPAADEALLSGSVDASYLGPNPSITGFEQSHGAIKIVAGAASGGAFFVVKPSIATVADLKGKAVASPQLGNTQDVALRTYLQQHGLKTDVTGGGDVSIRPEDNATIVQSFEQGLIVGAWVPEPYAQQLLKAGGKVLLDERTLWPGGRFVTTDLAVRTDYLRAHPEIIRRLLQGQVAAINLIHTNPARAEQLVGQGIQAATGQSVAPALIAASFASITFTNDPIAASLRTGAQHAKALGLLQSTQLQGIYSLNILNGVLRASHQPAVSG
jgi:NitT/TauT family transport system substrate-binding protein